MEQSLVVVQPPKAGGGEARYGMLEPVRQYALEKLEQCGDTADAHPARQEESRAVLGDAAFEEARERGLMMTFEQAVEYALEDSNASPA